MIALDNGDKIRGDASAATVVDFTLHGVVGTVVTQLADGQLPVAIGDLYTAGSAGIAVTSIILVNTDTSARIVNLYLTPSGGTARRLIPKDTSLGIGYTLITDGRTIGVYDASGQLLSTTTAAAHKTTHQDGGTDEISVAALSGLLADDQHVLDAEVTAVAIAHSLATAANDFLVASGAGAYVKKTLAETQTIIAAIAKALLTEQGDIIYASGVATPAALPHGTSGQALLSGGHGANPAWGAPSGLTVVRKTADEIVNNSTTLQNDDHLLLAVGANEVYYFHFLPLFGSSTVADIKIGFAYPSGCILRGFAHCIDSAGGAALKNLLETTVVDLFGGGATTLEVRSIWHFVVRNGATAGNFQIQWAQNTAEVSDTTMRKDACLIAHKLA